VGVVVMLVARRGSVVSAPVVEMSS
jgi:hypothetical protein